ncbi:MAG: conjugal transfer protein TraF [Oligoflexia bacterium]|nr:conjugal transfer protein TraF [Oligoflexia bacterium]
MRYLISPLCFFSFFIFTSFMTINALATEDKGFFDDRERGWWWYEKLIAAPEKEAQKKSPNEIQKDEVVTPKQMLEAQGKKWEDAMAQAVMVPTEKNIKKYLYLTKRINEQAQKFSVAFKESIWVNPELDYTLEKPTITEAIVAQNEKDFTKQEEDLRKIAKDYGLIFFFKGSCPHCHSFSPIIKKFGDEFNFSIVAVTLDGAILPEFASPKKNYLLGEKLNLSVVPALYLVNPLTNMIAPISFGYTDWSTLSQKIVVASQKMGSK